ncbi:hypothetical protein UlMin_001148 [Ulmus minor]
MSFLSWNVRGLGNPRALTFLRNLIRSTSPGMVFLCETRLTNSNSDRIRRLLRFNNCFPVNRHGTGGGLMLLWQNEWDVTIQSYSSGHIDATIISPDNLTWRLTCFYGNPHRELRKFSWDLLQRLSSLSNLPWLVVGDFNEIACDEEKRGGPPRSLTAMMNFSHALANCSLHDLGFKGPQFTWKNNSAGTKNIQERLDRMVAHPVWKDMFPNYRVYHLDFLHSDHRPLHLTLNQKPTRNRPRGFRFEPFWLKEEDFRETLLSSWPSALLQDPLADLSSCLLSCSSTLNSWNTKKFGNTQNAIKQQKSVINQLHSMAATPDILDQLNKAQTTLERLLTREELFWKQRARTDWLIAGDRNTKFFHSQASGRRRKNEIIGILNDSGNWVTDGKNIEIVVCHFFSNIFSSSNPSPEDVDGAARAIHKTFSEEARSSLASPFTAEHIRCAFFDMNPSKAPGPDGFHAIFFQKNWDIVGPKVTKACLAILNDGASIKAFNTTYVTLIPKKKSPISVADFRPISLCNVVYKIVSKAMANRLKLLLPEIIPDSQNAFAPGRLISDSVIVGYEMLNYINRRFKGKKGLMALKLDMSKAYDRVEWRFLSRLLDKMGFPANWNRLIMNCLSTVTYSFIINGTPCGSVTPQRGLRQGCPLSPYLFIICAEAFSSLISEAVSSRSLSGVKCSVSGPYVNHIFFADDSLVFCQADESNSLALLHILKDYEKGSGQQVNMMKSAITFSPNVDPRQKTAIMRSLNLNTALSHDRYLGLPNFVGRNKRKTFAGLIERVWQKTNSWNNSFFSAGGKEILIKAVAQAIPTYSMNIFKIPSTLCRELGSIVARFWWGSTPTNRKINWVSWEKMCLPKHKGGMGFRDLFLFNQSLVAKQAWRILKYPQSLMSRVLKGKYFPNGNFLSAPCKQTASFIWKSIVWGRELLNKGLIWKIGNGLSVKAFSDPWIARPMSFKPVTKNPRMDDPTVAEFLNPLGWNTQLLEENFWPIDIAEITNITVPRNREADKLWWFFEKKGSYTVKSGYKLACDLNNPIFDSTSAGGSNWWTTLWTLKLPPKIKNFLWRSCLNALPTKDNLVKRGIKTLQSCPRCGEVQESVLHVFFECIYARSLWEDSIFHTQVLSAQSSSYID